MGYLVGKATTEALLRMGEGAEYTVESVNAAIYGLTNMESDMWCKPWYYSSGPDLATSRTTPTAPSSQQDGQMVQFEDCFEIAGDRQQPAPGDPRRRGRMG